MQAMKPIQTFVDPEELVRRRFSEAGIEPLAVDRRDYPEETIFIVRVNETDLTSAAEIGNKVDYELDEYEFKGFVTVRAAKREVTEAATRLKGGVADLRATKLANLLVARSRTSENQPSLSYIPDTAQNLLTIITPRHQLIFGRRGAGKTALMVEAKSHVEKEGDLSLWINLLTYRGEGAHRTFLWISQRLCELVQVFYKKKDKAPSILAEASTMRYDLEKLLGENETSDAQISRLIPHMQGILRRFLESNASSIFIFLDDIHYLNPINQQPQLLDMIHGVVRDCDAWLKVAGIKHLSRWFQSKPPLGLQTGHDADHIDLDVTLENPSEATTYLEKVLKSYAEHVGISSLSSILSRKALDRLVLASGAVPRDYLVLTASAIRQAQKRVNTRLVGVQDVNRAAGDAANVKINELEDDAAAAEETTQTVLLALQKVRKFCIDEKSFTFFRIDFHDKENHPAEYNIMQELMDLRLIHLVDASLSDGRKAGRRSEVYMLDLSQFSGQRLKRRLKVLDFKSGYVVLKETGTDSPDKVATTPRQRVGLLRRAPLFELEMLSKNGNV